MAEPILNEPSAISTGLLIGCGSVALDVTINGGNSKSLVAFDAFEENASSLSWSIPILV